MKSKAITGSASLILCVLSAAAAAEESHWYTTASVGAGNLQSTTLVYSDGAQQFSADADFTTSFVGGGTLGYQFDNGWSIEGDIQYRRNELDPVDIGPLGSFSEGDFASLSFGASLLYRFGLGQNEKLTGYIGPGIVWIQEIDIDFDSDGQQEISFESDDTAFELRLGGRYELSDRLFIDTSVEYLLAGEVTLELPSDNSQTVSADYDHWSLNIGLGWRF